MNITDQLLTIHRFRKCDDFTRNQYIWQVVGDSQSARNFILNCCEDLSVHEACELIKGIVIKMPDDHLYELKIPPDIFFYVMEIGMGTSEFDKMIADFVNDKNLMNRFFIKFKNYLTNENYPRGTKICDYIMDIIDRYTY